MRKNYFAKKFVAYSMAFAVAFSTLTVSPVFVKEAKAAPASGTASATQAYEVKIADTNDATVGDYITAVLASKQTIANGNILLGDITSNDIINGTLIPCGSPDREDKFIELSKLDKTKLQGIAVTKSTTISGAYNVGGTVGAKQSVVINGTDNKNVKLNAGDEGIQHTWYKLEKKPGSFTIPQVNASSVVVDEKVSFDYYVLNELDDETLKTGETSKYNPYILPMVTADDTGIYLAVNKGTSTIAKVITLVADTDLKAAANKSKVLASEGQSVKLVVDATGTKTISYKWSKAGKTIEGETTNTLNIASVSASDFGKYTCTVSDDLKEIPVDVHLAQADASYANAANATTINTVVDKAIDASNHLNNKTVTLKTSIPGEDNYRYIWVYGGTSAVELSPTDELAFNSENKSVTITDKDLNDDYSATGVVKCYAVLKSLYDMQKADVTTDIGAAYKKIAEAKDDVTKYNAIQDLRTAEKTFAILDDDHDLRPDNVEYIENFSFTMNEALKNDVVVAKVGDKVTFTAPTLKDETVVSYLWEVNNSQNGYSVATLDDTNTFTIENVDVKDFGQVTCTITVCNDRPKHTAEELLAGATCGTTRTITYTANLVYASDLTVSASDVTAKVGAEKVKLSAVKNSSLPVTYQWYKDAGIITGATKADYTIAKVATGDIYVPAKNGTPEANVYRCLVSDGIISREARVKITEIPTFDVFDSVKSSEDEDNALLDDATLYASGKKDGKVTLAPVVVANEGINVTYKWEKAGQTLGTDATLTVDTPATVGTNVTYDVTITDGTKEITLHYVVSQVDSTKITTGTVDVTNYEKTNTYTGKAINPVKEVTFTRTISHLTNESDPTSRVVDYVENLVLTEGVDYEVILVENINVGIARFAIKMLGAYEDVLNAKTLATNYEEFYIDRADNELTVADKTVVLGGSVQPKTTNKAGAAVTYTYYADEACTTALEAAPTKVGTYYVKATSIATTNYNEATSNVAKVVVVPGKVKMLSTSRTASSVKLNWNKATGATSYRVYYKAPGAKSYKVFKNTTATSMNVTGLASATTYTFAVKAYAKTAGYSTVYATKQTTTAPAKVATPSVTARSKKATVKFTKVARATGYQIYMAKGNGKYVKVKTTTSTSFTKTGLAKGATYKFKVRAYKTVGSNTYYGAFSSAKAVVVK